MLKLLSVCVLAYWCISCGGDTKVYEQAPSKPAPPAPSAAWLAVKADVDANCAKCHNGSGHPLDLRTEANFRLPKVKARIEAGTMPPAPTKLDPVVRDGMLAFLAKA